MRRKDRFILLFIATAFIISEVPAATQKDHALLYPSLAPQSSLQGKKFNALIELAEFMASRQGGKRLDQQIVTELRRLEARRQQAQGRTARATAQATSKVAQDLLELSRHVIQDLRSNINIFADQLMGITQYKGDTYPPTIFGPILNAMTHGMPLAWDSQTGRKTAGLFITDHNAGGERILSIFDIEFARQRAGGDYIPTLSRENALRLVTTLADQMERRIQEGVIAAVGERICTDTARKLRDASPSNPYRPEAINKLRQTLQAVNSASSAQENPMSKTLIGIILDVSRTNPLLIVSNLTELVSRSKPNSSGETVVSVLGIPFAKEKRTDGRLTAISAVDAESVDAKAARIIEALARYIESKAVKTAPAAQAAPATRDTQLIIAQVLRAQAAKLRGKTNPERAAAIQKLQMALNEMNGKTDTVVLRTAVTEIVTELLGVPVRATDLEKDLAKDLIQRERVAGRATSLRFLDVVFGVQDPGTQVITTAGPMVGVRAMNMVDKLADYLSINADKNVDKFAAATPAAAPAQAAQQTAPATRDMQLIIAQVLRAQAAKLRGKTNPERAAAIQKLQMALNEMNGKTDTVVLITAVTEIVTELMGAMPVPAIDLIPRERVFADFWISFAQGVYSELSTALQDIDVVTGTAAPDMDRSVLRFLDVVFGVQDPGTQVITTAGPMVGVRAMNMVDKLADYLSINADKFVAATPVAAPAQAAQAAAAQAADVRPEAFLEALRTMASILQPGTSLTNQLQELRRLSLAVGQLNTLRGALHNALQSAGRRSTAA